MKCVTCAFSNSPSPLRAVKMARPLPDPLRPDLRESCSRSMLYQPKDHACAAPWEPPGAHCDACDYKKDPAAYDLKYHRSTLICALRYFFINMPYPDRFALYEEKYWTDWSTEVLEALVGELDKPRAERRWTDEQVCDTAFVPEDPKDAEVMKHLRILHRV